MASSRGQISKEGPKFQKSSLLHTIGKNYMYGCDVLEAFLFR